MTQMKLLPGEYVLSDEDVQHARSLFLKQVRRAFALAGRQLDQLFRQTHRSDRLRHIRSSYRARKGKRW